MVAPANALVLHLDLISLVPAISNADREGLRNYVADLASLPGVVGCGLIEGEPGSDYDLAVFFALEGLGALERFGTDPRYTRFLQGRLAPVLQGLAGADARLEAWPDAPYSHALSIAVTAPDEAYDWEVRSRLDEWTTGLAGARVLGVAVGERQRFRGLALVLAEGPIEARKPAAERRFGPLSVNGAARRFA